jgi:hypothetical protein
VSVSRLISPKSSGANTPLVRKRRSSGIFGALPWLFGGFSMKKMVGLPLLLGVVVNEPVVSPWPKMVSKSWPMATKRGSFTPR